MLTNKQIHSQLKHARSLRKFAKFLGISDAGLWNKLKKQDRKNNLYGVYIEFLTGTDKTK